MRELLDALRSELLGIAPAELLDRNPPKFTHVLRRNDVGVSRARSTVMSARLRDGTTGTKMILVDEDTRHVRSMTSLTLPDGGTGQVESADLTALRCGLMTALVLERFGLLGSSFTYGYIGTGRVNCATASVIAQLCGSYSSVIRGPQRDRAWNQGHFEALGLQVQVDRGRWPSLLRNCDVVISCTTASHEGETLSYDQLSGPGLFIAQDSGFILGTTFRQRVASYSDHPAQLRSHWKEEFPWDEQEPSFGLVFTDEVQTPAAVYLHGIALADLVVARARREGRI